jgi:hypothetical protein
MSDSPRVLSRLAFLAAVATTGSVLAAEPPATGPAAPATPAPPGAAPAAAPDPAAAPAPASDAPATKPAREDKDADGGDDASIPDSEENAAVPPPDTSPSAIFKTRSPGPAPQPQRDINQIDDGRMGTHQEHWQLGLGLRESFVTNEGYDLFAENNALPQVSVHAGRVLYASGPISVAALLAWDWGSVESDARGAKTALEVNRFTVGAEGRFHVLRRVYAFGRVAPGALNAATSFSDRIVGADRKVDGWGFAADLSLGAGFEFAGDARGASSRPRGFLIAEGGYGWAQSMDLLYEAEGDTNPVRLQPLDLGELAIRGGYFRLSAVITY